MNTPQDSNSRPSSRGQTTGSTVGDNAEQLTEKVRVEGQEQVQHYRERAADKVEALAGSIQAAASELQDDDIANLSRHVSDMASGLSRLSNGLREKSIDEIVRDVRQVARENPALFIAGSIAIGFGISRFARASVSSGQTREESRFTDEASQRRSWADADTAERGRTEPAVGNRGAETSWASDTGDTIPKDRDPAASAADAIAARTGTTASGTPTGGRDTPPSTGTPSGRSQP